VEGWWQTGGNLCKRRVVVERQAYGSTQIDCREAVGAVGVVGEVSDNSISIIFAAFIPVF
jgi:hypothetical protein